MTDSLLTDIEYPAELRKLEPEQLPALCDEVRDYLLHSVSASGGHLAAGLGVVELTVALHYVFDTPEDRLLWDVGHQAYAHKVLTGRREQLSGIRKQGGLSGFPKRDESEYDTFGVGHSSTSISAALGMALAAKHQGIERQIVSVIGDGAMTAGMAYEALNHAGDLESNMLVVLNDNDMSISPNVGGLRRYLTRLLSGGFYAAMRDTSKKILSKTPGMKKFARRAEGHTKGMLMPAATMFEEMGFVYFGPVDGHDVIELVHILNNIKHLDEPRFLHVVTKKGKGYKPAEKDPVKYHGVDVFNPAKGIVSKKQKAITPTYTQVFGQWLCDMAEKDVRLIGITPAMREGSGLVEFSRRFPKRYYDVAIAEQHALTLAAGLACDGMKPVVAIYSTFLQRAYDQLIHDIAIQNLPVVFAIDRAGLVGADGATHSGNYDVSYLRCIPNLVIMAASDENECRQMLYTAFMHHGPAAVRYPRGKGVGIQPGKKMQRLELGQSEALRKGKQIAICCFGALKAEAIEVAEQLDATLVNMRFIKPMDEARVLELADTHQLIVTLEDSAVKGGAGSAVSELLHQQRKSCDVLNLGIPDEFIEHATREQQLTEIGLDVAGILERIATFHGGEYCASPKASVVSLHPKEHL